MKFYEVTHYNYDGCGRSYDDSHSFHWTYKGAAKRINEIAEEDSDLILQRDESDNSIYAIKYEGQYGYTKYYVQMQEMEE